MDRERYRAFVAPGEMTALRCATPPVDLMELAIFTREIGAVVSLGLELTRADAEVGNE